jgi:3',5'-cyclic-AMP phosphodiesterase
MFGIQALCLGLPLANMHFVQLSDTHITHPNTLAYQRIDTATALRAAVARVLSLAQPPHFVVITGDLVDHADEAEYLHLRELISPFATHAIPVYLIPGNHDNRAALRKVFADHAYLGAEGYVQYVIDHHAPLRLIALDTQKDGRPEGELCAQRLNWLEAQLAAAPHTPTVVLMHHPPFETLIHFMDEMGLTQGAEQLERILSAHPQVQRLLCGHIHRQIEARFGGTIASVCTSTAHQLHLNIAPDGTPAYTLEPPSFKLHAWSDKSGLISHAVAISGWGREIAFM